MRRFALCAAGLLLAAIVVSVGGSATQDGNGVSLILYGGIIIPMTSESARFEAIAIAGDTILSLGSDEEVLALATPETELVDLGGAALFPGFIDPHTHLFDNAEQEGMSLAEVQQMAIENGITTAANMHTSPWNIDGYISFAETGGMRLRLHLYLVHTNSCGETEGFWYEKYAPDEEIAPGLYMGGVKLFAEQSVCAGTIVYTFSEDARRALPEKGRQQWADASLIRSEEELVEVLERVQANGYQAAIHAIGDLAAETCLNAYETVLAGEPNTLRHMILHNHFLQDDMLPRYSELGVIALVEMSSPAMLEAFSELVGEENLSLFRRWDELLSTGAHVALDSDWPYFPISPIDKLRAFVGGESVHPGVLERTQCPCPDRIPQTVTMWQGLQMMTTSAAYSLRIEDTLGSLEPGKLADLVILTGNPLGIEPSELSELTVAATYIDGKLEYSDGEVVAEYQYLHDKAITQSLPLSQIEWVASINDDVNPDTPGNRASIVHDTDRLGEYYGMTWNSPQYTDLSLNGLDRFERTGSRSIRLTLSGSEPMDVGVVVGISGDYCGNAWRSATAEESLQIGTEPQTFMVSCSEFSDDPWGTCDGPLPEDALEGIYSIYLLPETREGELRVYEVAICEESSQSGKEGCEFAAAIEMTSPYLGRLGDPWSSAPPIEIDLNACAYVSITAQFSLFGESCDIPVFGGELCEGLHSIGWERMPSPYVLEFGGTVPITVTATDVNGCTLQSAIYANVEDGTSPELIAALDEALSLGAGARIDLNLRDGESLNIDRSQDYYVSHGYWEFEDHCGVLDIAPDAGAYIEYWLNGQELESDDKTAVVSMEGGRVGEAFAQVSQIPVTALPVGTFELLGRWYLASGLLKERVVRLLVSP